MADEETKTQENPEEAPAEAEQPAAEEKPKAEKAPAKKAAKKSGSSDSIIDQIKNMTVLELAELVKALEEEFGVTFTEETRPMTVYVIRRKTNGQ